jgi:hypothetical protein
VCEKERFGWGKGVEEGKVYVRRNAVEEGKVWMEERCVRRTGLEEGVCGKNQGKQT